MLKIRVCLRRQNVSEKKTAVHSRDIWENSVVRYFDGFFLAAIYCEKI